MEQRDEVGTWRRKANEGVMMESMYAEIRKSLAMPIDASGIILSLTGIFQDLMESRHEASAQNHLRSTE